jgi:signal transduction histidine kinase
LEFVVEDGGPGIPEADREHLFDRFHRGRASADSTGLGLSIVRSIARAHGGDIAVHESELGGAAFVLGVPLAAIDPSLVPASEEEGDE